MLPRARKKQLVVQPLDDEILIYDLSSDRAHCLNRTAALVWRYSDGKTDVARIVKKLAAATGEPVNQYVVELALQRLRKAQLLDKTDDARQSGHFSRRDALRTLGKVAAVTLPLVTSIVAPEAVQAASCVPTNMCTKARGGLVNAKCCCNKQPCSTSKNTCAGTTCKF